MIECQESASDAMKLGPNSDGLDSEHIEYAS